LRILRRLLAVASFLFHARQSFRPAINQGDAAILFCLFLSLCRLLGPWRVQYARRGDKLIALIRTCGFCAKKHWSIS
jgi:hypothetical protein